MENPEFNFNDILKNGRENPPAGAEKPVQPPVNNQNSPQQFDFGNLTGNGNGKPLLKLELNVHTPQELGAALGHLKGLKGGSSGAMTTIKGISFLIVVIFTAGLFLEAQSSPKVRSKMQNLAGIDIGDPWFSPSETYAKRFGKGSEATWSLPLTGDNSNGSKISDIQDYANFKELGYTRLVYPGEVFKYVGALSKGNTTGIDADIILKYKRIMEYINTYAPLAQEQMRSHGIPASITLAQGIVESNAGESYLAQKANNHFGIKCFSRSCAKGHCINRTDDHHKDFFRTYQEPRGSYLSHAEFLRNGARYKSLFNSRNYRDWANGLENAGYATSRSYAESLISTVEAFNLQQYDK